MGVIIYGKTKPDKITYGDATTIEKDMREIQDWLKEYPNGAVLVTHANGEQLLCHLNNGVLEFIPVSEQ